MQQILPHQLWKVSERTEDRRDAHQFPFVDKLGNVPSVPSFLGFLKIDSHSIFLFQLPNPLLQKLTLGFLLGQRQSFFIRGPGLSHPTEPAAHLCTG
jgi:hypothetical protein